MQTAHRPAVEVVRPSPVNMDRAGKSAFLRWQTILLKILMIDRAAFFQRMAPWEAVSGFRAGPRPKTAYSAHKRAFDRPC